MIKIDYTKLDAAIQDAIGSGHKTFNQITFSNEVASESKALEQAWGKPSSKPAWRFVDSRLQALRKRGAIAFIRALVHGYCAGVLLGSRP